MRRINSALLTIMKPRKSIFKLVSFAVLLTIAQVGHANLITNGGFESNMDGWTCFLSGGDANCDADNFGGAQEGSLHFFGFDNGSGGILSQFFATSIGAEYDISFFFGSSSPTNFLSFAVGGVLAQTFTFAESDSWDFFTSTFTAISDNSLLQFFFITNDGTGSLWLDAIVIELAEPSQVPEPGTLVLLGIGLAGMGQARRRRKV